MKKRSENYALKELLPRRGLTMAEVREARAALVAEGIVEDSGFKRDGQTVWRITQKGIRVGSYMLAQEIRDFLDRRLANRPSPDSPDAQRYDMETVAEFNQEFADRELSLIKNLRQMQPQSADMLFEVSKAPHNEHDYLQIVEALEWIADVSTWSFKSDAFGS